MPLNRNIGHLQTALMAEELSEPDRFLATGVRRRNMDQSQHGSDPWLGRKGRAAEGIRATEEPKCRFPEQKSRSNLQGSRASSFSRKPMYTCFPLTDPENTTPLKRLISQPVLQDFSELSQQAGVA